MQVPLQPLQDNLESQTYEVFEKDVTKYTTYEDAIALAISSLRPSLPPATHEAASSSSAGLPNGTAAHHNSTVGRLVIMVVGAGRGPLVRASLQAAKRTRRSVHVYAVEKNPNAVLTLHRMVALDRWAPGLLQLAPRAVRACTAGTAVPGPEHRCQWTNAPCYVNCMHSRTT